MSKYYWEHSASKKDDVQLFMSKCGRKRAVISSSSTPQQIPQTISTFKIKLNAAANHRTTYILPWYVRLHCPESCTDKLTMQQSETEKIHM